MTPDQIIHENSQSSDVEKCLGCLSDDPMALEQLKVTERKIVSAEDRVETLVAIPLQHIDVEEGDSKWSSHMTPDQIICENLQSSDAEKTLTSPGSHDPMVLEQLRVTERKIVDRVETLVAIPLQHIDTEDALDSSLKSEELGSSHMVHCKHCLCTLRSFASDVEWLLQNPDHGTCAVHTILRVTSNFKLAAQTCLEMVDGFCEFHDSETIELFVMRAVHFTMVNPVLSNLEEFPKCLIWFFSWSKKWESTLDFVRSYFQGDCVGCLVKLHLKLGSVFIVTAEKEEIAEKNAETLNIAADHMCESGRIYSTAQHFELASKAYYEAVRTARVSKNLQKAGSILIEALEATMVWNGHENCKLWEYLHVLVSCYQADNKFSEATNLLKRGLALTCKVLSEHWRKSLAVGIRRKLGNASLLCGSHDRVPESTLQGDGLHHLRTSPLENSGDTPNASPDAQSLEEWICLTEHERTSLGRELVNKGKFQEAHALYNFFSQVWPGSTNIHMLKFNAAYAQYNSGAREEGLTAFEEALAAITSDSELLDKRFQVELLIKYSDLLNDNGDIVKSREVMKEAQRVFCNADFVNLSTFFCYGARRILGWFVDDCDISSASDFSQHLDSGISSAKHGSRCPEMQLLKSRFWVAMADHESAANHLEAYYENEDQCELAIGGVDDLFNTRTWESREFRGHNPDSVESWHEEVHNILYKNQVEDGSTEASLTALIKAKSILQNELWNDPVMVGPVSLRLAFHYYAHHKLRLAEEECEIATKCFEALEEHHPDRIHHLGLLYICKAMIVGHKLHYDEAHDWINSARPFMEGIDPTMCDYLIANLKRRRYGVDANISREIIKINIMKEVRFSSAMDSLWIDSLEDTMQFYRDAEWYALAKVDRVHEGSEAMEALLWVERSRMRLFMHISGEHDKTSKLADFDESDICAGGMIKTVLEVCGNNVAVIEYSYWGDDTAGNLFIYVIFMSKGKLMVYPMRLNLLAELKAKWNMNLEHFVDSVMIAITSKEEGDKKAKEYLSYLHDVLGIGFIMQRVPRHCNTLVFAPHGHLSFLPFHALYDKFRDEFLIQRYRICYIPSIRALSHCLELQKWRKTSSNSDKIEPAFVAGNPHPMGCNMSPLPGAEEEAKEVAEILGVQPCVREQMTKAAVKEGLCGSSIVLLATHALYPPGAIVVQGLDHQIDTTNDIDDDNDIEDNDDIVIDTSEDEMITANELKKLPVSAALVVLDGCETGKGEVKSEGVLGLGRSVLQAGASTVVLSLWKVDDQATRTLVTGTFQNAIRSPDSVSDSLGTSMLNMLHDTNIYHWAPLIALGSPTLCINDLIPDVEKRVDAVCNNSATSQMLKQCTIKLDKGKEAQISSQNFHSNVEDNSSFQRIHQGIICDGCDTDPIIGSRFKARASYKDDYDLCLRCFTSSGCTLGQFDRIELPLTFLEHGTSLDPCLVGCWRESCIRGGKCHCIDTQAVTQEELDMDCIDLS